MLRRGLYASPMSESVHGRLGSSMVIEDQSEGYHHGARNPSVALCGLNKPHNHNRNLQSISLVSVITIISIDC